MLFNNVEKYVFEDNDAPLIEHDKKMQMAKTRQKSITGLKISSNLSQLQKHEQLLSRRKSSVAISTPPRNIREQKRKVTLKQSVNAVRAALNFSQGLKKDDAKVAEDSGMVGESARRQSFINQPSPLKRSGLSMSMIARLGARKMQLSPTQSVDDVEVKKVQKITWASKFFRKSLHRFRIKGEAKQLFHNGVKKVLILLKWQALLKEEAKTVESEMKTFLDLAQDFEEDKVDIAEKSGLTFDVRLYKACNKMKLTEETTMVLTSAVSTRTNEAVQKAQSELQCLQSFSEYPIHMQLKLAKVMWLQEIEPKRVIIKEGHHPENFYFILSGQANVKKLLHNKDTGVPTMTTLGRLKDGQCFGEVALLHQSNRTATVETASTCQLLLVGREAFIDIFLNTNSGIEPDHIKYLRNLKLFKNWPISLLAEATRDCMFNFFRRGCVVVPDSTKNDWIYIVKSGSCQILKRLDAVNPRKTWIRRMEPNTLKLPRIGTADIVAKTDSNAPPMSMPKVPETIQRAMTEFFTTQKNMNGSKDDHNENEQPPNSPTPRTVNSASSNGARKEIFSRQSSKSSSLGRPGSVSPDGSGRGTPVELSGTRSVRRQSTKSPDGSTRTSVCSLPKLQTNHNSQKPQCTGELRADDMSKNGTVDEHKKTTDGTINGTKSQVLPEKKPKSKQPCFIKLRKLLPGETFGLEDIEFENEQLSGDQPSVSLVSNGAELVMISKSFFVRHCTEQAQIDVRHLIQRYPSDDALQNNLQTEVNWTLYKNTIINDFFTAREVS